MRRIVASAGYPAEGHRGITALRLADVIDAGPSIGPAFDRLIGPEQSRKGGSIIAGLAQALRMSVTGRHVVACTDADLSANLAQLGTLAAPILRPGCPDRPGHGTSTIAVLGQRYGMPDAVLVKPGGPVREPISTGGKPDKIIVLFRHAVRATLIPELAHVLDTQAGFKAFDAAGLHAVLPKVSSFDQTFDVELLIHLAQQFGAAALAIEPIVFTEDSIKDFYAAGGEDTTRSAEFVIDAGEPAILIGSDTGANPAEYLLHALAACLTTSIVYVAAARKVQLTSVESTLTGDMDVRGALGVDDKPRNGFERIGVSFHVTGNALEEKLREVVERAQKRSAVYDMVTNGVPVAVDVTTY